MSLPINPGFTPGTGLQRRGPFIYQLLVGILRPVIVPILRLSPPDQAGGMLAGLALGEISPPGKSYASLVKRRLTWTEPSELARLDDVMNKLRNDSARMVGLPQSTQAPHPGTRTVTIWGPDKVVILKTSKGMRA